MDIDTRGEQVEVDTFLDSALESVDRAEELVVDVAKKAGIDEDDALSLGMAIRECAVNAVVHGNRYNLNKKVHLTVARTPEQVVIKIADEGEGFELKSCRIRWRRRICCVIRVGGFSSSGRSPTIFRCGG